MVSKLTILITTIAKGTGAYKTTQAGISGVGKSASIAGGALASMAAVGVAAFLGASIQKAAEFSDKMQEVAAATGATDKQFEQLSDEAKRIGREFGRFTAAEAAEGMRNLAFAGFTVEQTLGAIEPVLHLSQAGLIGVGEAANAVAGAIRAFNLDISEATRVADVMTATFLNSSTMTDDLAQAIRFVGPVAAEAGMSFEELNATLGILGNAMIKGGRAGAQMRNILIRLQAPTTEARRLMTELGLELFRITPTAASFQRAFNKDVQVLNRLEAQMEDVSNASKTLQAALSKLNVQEAKNNLEIMKIRDKAADNNRELTGQELESIAKLEAKNRDLSISSQELSIQQDELSIKEKELQASIDVTSTSMEENSKALEANKGELLSITEIADQFNVALEGLSDAQRVAALDAIFGRRNIAAFQVILNSMTEETEGATTALEAMIETLLNSEGAAEEASDKMEEGLGNQIKKLKAGFEDFMLTVGDKVAPGLLALGKIINDEVVPFVKAFFEAFGPLLKLLLEYNPYVWLFIGALRILTPLLEALTPPLNLLADALNSLFNWLKKIIDKFNSATGAADKFKKAARSVGGVVSNIGTGKNLKVVGSALGFDTGGVVPGAIGEPQLAVVHGGETVRTPQQENDLGSNGSVTTNDTYNITIMPQGPMTKDEINRISRQLTDQLIEDKRKAMKNNLTEVV